MDLDLRECLMSIPAHPTSGSRLRGIVDEWDLYPPQYRLRVPEALRMPHRDSPWNPLIRAPAGFEPLEFETELVPGRRATVIMQRVRARPDLFVYDIVRPASV